jgi:hypothetical protein
MPYKHDIIEDDENDYDCDMSIIGTIRPVTSITNALSSNVMNSMNRTGFAFNKQDEKDNLNPADRSRSI